jgi:hypothetical protein
MKLDRVTITGADDSTKPEALFNLSEEFPFVEWGILFSKSNQGEPRYPSTKWIHEFLEKMDKWIDSGKPRLKLSAHLCGRWVRDVVLDGKFTFYEESPENCWPYFQRIQLNFHAHKHPPCSGFLPAIQKHDRREFIFQLDGVNDVVWKGARDKGISAVPLFDRSGGAGVVPNAWPRAYPGAYNGYAGGLGPDTLEEELKKIAVAAGTERIWIDMETRVRSNNDRTFDIAKVRSCLEISKPFVT